MAIDGSQISSNAIKHKAISSLRMQPEENRPREVAISANQSVQEENCFNPASDFAPKLLPASTAWTIAFVLFSENEKMLP